MNAPPLTNEFGVARHAGLPARYRAAASGRGGGARRSPGVTRPSPDNSVSYQSSPIFGWWFAKPSVRGAKQCVPLDKQDARQALPLNKHRSPRSTLFINGLCPSRRFRA
jgi:hypothetical protein